MSKTISSSTVKRGRGYEGLDAFEVVNPDGDKMPPGRTIMVCPEHEEAPAWRAILAGCNLDGTAYVVPLDGHFGNLEVRRLLNTRGLCLSRDEPSPRDECDWVAAKRLALSTAMAFGLLGCTWTV
jgi:hypothetical protein